MCAKLGCSVRRVGNVCLRKVLVLGVLLVFLMGSLAAAREYRAGTPIGDVSITSPAANQFWAAGSTHTLTCTTSTDTDQYRDDPEDDWEDIDDSVTHYWTSSAGAFQDNDNVGTSVTYICPVSPGTVTLNVYANDNYAPENNDALYDESATSDTETVTIVTVAKIQWKDGATWTDVSGVLNVRTGTTVSYKAIPAPAGASWPAGNPVWGYNASGTGETKDVTYGALSTSTSDYKIVGARCGTQPWVKVNAIVFDFAVKTTPIDDFDGRSQSKFGLEEEVALSIITNPTGVNPGTIAWTKANGVGSITGTSYDAEHVAGGVTIRATIQTGPSKGSFSEAGRTVVAPSGEYMIKKPNSGIRHTTNTCSVGILGWSYLEPKDVSFSKIKRREGTCVGTGTGFYAYLNGDVHAVGNWQDVGPGNIATGCRVLCDDRIYSGAKGAPYSVGTFNWPIPREYKADDGVPHQIRIANHNQVSDANGKCTIKKGGTLPYSKNAADPTSSW